MIIFVSLLAAPLYLLALRFLSPAAWADVVLLARKVLPRRRRKTPQLSLEGPPAPIAPGEAGGSGARTL